MSLSHEALNGFIVFANIVSGDLGEWSGHAANMSLPAHFTFSAFNRFRL